ncbi:Molybdopterin-synthase sulfurtransferase [Pseudovirgaria hyperparasitica]|uniref:Adenylyltransferase and sulfurtransferase uba4 n=1 Tax=Pseudovirgaria hyperparasitica TaxID=470096 RepID=A0A6A6VR34_9PEZI|nr:Molybdopterin-synthase sulfurtransferase [Pseudovirgaria hyperparasitica]KAF2753128.1 Molybdopterin-synthase sulfurtransferase [Pseudovirgaria hyperparasitica]
MNDGVPDDVKNEIFAALRFGDGEVERKGGREWPLSGDEYRRYGRQLIMPEVGLAGQMKLKNASVLIVGVGGLGCPAAAYLAGAGVGTIGLVDADDVEVSNLHRQILHGTAKVGMSKVESAVLYINGLNDEVQCIPHHERIFPENALGIISQYDVVLDCTDTPASRYLISDSCVLLRKPLVSASALRTEGQLMVLNNPPRPAGDVHGGPCYRCIFPKPPPAASVVTCGEGGILGPVVGTMGVLQSLEALKVIIATSSEEDTPMELDEIDAQQQQQQQRKKADPPNLLLFSSFSKPMFRSIRLRSRRADCAACSAQASVTVESLNSGSLDYVQFCGVSSPVAALQPSERISVKSFAQLIADSEQEVHFGRPLAAPPVVLDVREKVQFDLCSLKGSINIPYSVISSTDPSATGPSATWVDELRRIPLDQALYIICRLGNDSQLTVKRFRELALDEGGRRRIVDVAGGLKAWRDKVDRDFPEY